MDLELVELPMRPGRRGLLRVLDVLFTGIQPNTACERE
jgi:hypothetical protein